MDDKKVDVMQPARTVVAFQDLTGVGRCALMIAIPVISALGVQVIPAPTALLSAHTGFPDYVVSDVTEYLRACTRKWGETGIRTDCVYTGYLGSETQVEIAAAFMRAQPRALRVVDPVLGDDGRMYKGMSDTMPERLKLLCRDADVITPNLTETALLTGLPYESGEYSTDMLCERLRALLELGPKRALITGARHGGTHVNAWMQADGVLRLCAYDAVPASFPGTGDLFASALTGALTRGDTFEEALCLATEYVRATMEVTLCCGSEPLDGVQLEKTLPLLYNGGMSI